MNRLYVLVIILILSTNNFYSQPDASIDIDRYSHPIYLRGSFNDWQVLENNKMKFDEYRKEYYLTTQLKSSKSPYQFKIASSDPDWVWIQIGGFNQEHTVRLGKEFNCNVRRVVHLNDKDEFERIRRSAPTINLDLKIDFDGSYEFRISFINGNISNVNLKVTRVL